MVVGGWRVALTVFRGWQTEKGDGISRSQTAPVNLLKIISAQL